MFVAFSGPAPSPGSTSTVPEANIPASAPESNTTPSFSPDSEITPPSTGVDSEVPTTNPGSRPTVTPSAATSSYAYSPLILAGSALGYLFLF